MCIYNTNNYKMWIKTYVENWGGSVKKKQIKTKNDKGKKTGGGDGVEKLIGAGVDIRVKKKKKKSSIQDKSNKYVNVCSYKT